jgi:hypothetical protein
MRTRFATRRHLGLTEGEFGRLARLDTPQKIQRFLNATPINHELGGETLYSVREVLRNRRAHCMEGAFLAAAALWIHGEPPLMVHLDCDLSDYPHAIVVFRRGRCWGAISKTNGAPLRFRDPVYRSVRELAMSYFHEYFDKRGRKTLRSFSRPYDMRHIAPEHWVTNGKHCWDVHDRLAELRHFPLVTKRQERLLVPRDPFERQIGKLVQYPKPEKPGKRPTKK